MLNEISMALCDDITSPTGSVELIRLTVSKLLVLLPLPDPAMRDASIIHTHQIQMLCGGLQVDNQLYSRASFHFPVLLCQEQLVDKDFWVSDGNAALSPEALEEFRRMSFLCVGLTLSGDWQHLEQINFRVKPTRVYLEDTFIYYLKTLFHAYIPSSTLPTSGETGPGTACPVVPVEVYQSDQAVVWPIRLHRLLIEPVSLLVSVHASLKLYIASDHTPLSFSVFERGLVFTTPRQLVHSLTMHYAAGALFRAGM